MCTTASTCLREEDITDIQHQKIKELKERLGDQLLQNTSIFNDNFSLLRWLIGWNYKIDEIVPRFQKTSSALRCLKISNLVIEDVDELNAYVRKTTTAAEHFPGGVMSLDDDGNVIALQVMGRSMPKKLARCGRISDVYRLTVIETALIYQLVRLQERKHKHKVGLRCIIDLEGFNSEHLNTCNLKTYANVLRQLQCMFPDLTRQVYIINAPTMVSAAYKVIKTVLSEQSREKVVFLSSDYHETLAKELGAHNLLERWGGLMKPRYGDQQSGLLRMGGLPDQQLRYLAEKNPCHVQEDHLIRLYIPARSRKEVDLEVGKAGDYIQWYFITNGDIEFSVVDGQGNELWPNFRLTTDFVPEFGRIQCSVPGTHKIIFDNTLSNFFSKEIKFKVYVKQHE